MDALSCLLDSHLSSGKGETSSKNIYHLIYVDDLLFFGKAYLHIPNNLISALQTFNEISNLKLILQSPISIFFSNIWTLIYNIKYVI